MEADDFWSLSQALTGIIAADRRLAPALLEGIATGRAELVERLLQDWAAKPAGADPHEWIAANFWSDADTKRVCQDIILSWLFGQVFKDGAPQPAPAASQELLAALWFSGAFWGLAKAHPPGIPGGYFGHWSYPSEA